MKAVVLEEYGDNYDVLVLKDVQEPEMRPNDVIVDVHAAGFNPFDCKLRKGWLDWFYPMSLPNILGMDFAGIVAATGDEVVGLSPGDEVWGMAETMRPGTYAEKLAINFNHVRSKPANLSFEEAATVPMVAMTGWLALVEMGRVDGGMNVLVHGGGGGVGSFCIMLARYFGASVTTTCGPNNVEFCKSLGADVVIDYKNEDFKEVAKDIDLVLDPLGGQVNLDSYTVMRKGGTILVVLRGDKIEMENRERLCAEYGVNSRVVEFEARPDILDKVRPLYEDGSLKPVVRSVEPLEKVADVHRDSDEQTILPKVVFKIR